jgi:hypothetical protein
MAADASQGASLSDNGYDIVDMIIHLDVVDDVQTRSYASEHSVAAVEVWLGRLRDEEL